MSNVTGGGYERWYECVLMSDGYMCVRVLLRVTEDIRIQVVQ